MKTVIGGELRIEVALNRWTIYHDRGFGGPWHYVHVDYDGAPDAYDNRHGSANTVEECIQAIEEYET